MSAQRPERPLLLGERLATYRSPPLSAGIAVIWVGLPLAGWLQACARLGGPEGLACGALMAVPAIGWLAWRMAVAREVELHQNGFEYRVGGRPQYVYWSQIQEIYQTPVYHLNRLLRPRDEPDDWTYRIARRDGRGLRLVRLESSCSLGECIQRQVVRRNLPVVLDAFRAGYSIRFGRHLSVSLEGVRVSGRLVEWREIAKFDLADDGHVRIVCRSQFARRGGSLVCRQRVPNRLLLGELIRASRESDPLEQATHRAAAWFAEESQLSAPSDDYRPRRPR